MKKQRFLFPAMVMVLLASLVPVFAVASSKDTEESNADKNYVAVEINALFMDTMEENQFFEKTYGGAYIDRDGNYHICVTSEDALSTLKNTVTEDKIRNVEDATALDDVISAHTAESVKGFTVNYHIVTFSYHYLSEIVDLLGTNMVKLGIEQVGVKQADNVVDVYINANADQSEILSFLNQHLPDFDCEAIRFLEGQPLVLTVDQTAISWR